MLGSTSCPVVEGWQERISTKTLSAGAVGGAIGAVAAVASGHPVIRYSLQTCLGFTALGALFSCIQETCRLVRCDDSPVNAAFGGAAVGHIVHRAAGRDALRGALVYGLVAAGAQAAADAWHPGESVRELLERMDLLDTPAPEALQRREAVKAARESAERRAAERAGPGWLERLGDRVGMRRLSKEDWDAYLEAEREDRRQRVKKALEGRVSDQEGSRQ